MEKPTSLRFREGRDALNVSNSRGDIWVWRLSPLVYASRVTGYLDPSMAKLIIDVANPLYDNGVVSGFHDWFEMTAYHSQARIDLTNWVLSHRRSKLFIGVKSKIVAMGVSVANLALGSAIQIYSSPAPLEAALTEALRER